MIVDNALVPTQVTVCDRAGDPLDVLREKAKSAWQGNINTGWDFACYVAEICAVDRWRSWGFKTMRDWIEVDFPNADVPNVSHYKAIGSWLLNLPPHEQEQWKRTPIWKAIDGRALLADETSRHELLEYIGNGATNAEIRKKVAKTKPDLHLETEWRTIHCNVPLPAYERWTEALNLARYWASQDNPDMGTLVEAMAQALLGEWPQLSKEGDAVRQVIIAGEYRCRECGSWNAANLERHHVIPRSHQGHEGPIVLLCSPCHAMVTRNEGGTWREYARKWGIEVTDG